MTFLCRGDARSRSRIGKRRATLYNTPTWSSRTRVVPSLLRALLRRRVASRTVWAGNCRVSDCFFWVTVVLIRKSFTFHVERTNCSTVSKISCRVQKNTFKNLSVQLKSLQIAKYSHFPLFSNRRRRFSNHILRRNFEWYQSFHENTTTIRKTMCKKVSSGLKSLETAEYWDFYFIVFLFH